VELYGKVNRGLGKLGRWFRSNRLTLNLKKTEYVDFSRTRPPEVLLRVLEYDREQIKRVEGAGFLGVWIDARIKWRGHVGQVRQLLGVLGRIRADVDEYLLLSIYNNMVLPHLQHCLMVWVGTLKRAGMGHMGRPGDRGRTSSISLQSVQNGNLSRSCRKERQKISMVYKGGKTLRPHRTIEQ
jgi:hypothetical protein